MKRSAILTSLLVLGLTSGVVLGEGAGGSVGETIAARRGLMVQLSTLQMMIDARIDNPDNLFDLLDLSAAAAASLNAFALLLPPDTNLLGGAPAVEGVDTTAAANIWDDLPGFEKLVRDTAAQARAAAETTDLAGFTAAWGQVAEACSSCHATYVFYDPFAAIN